MHSSVKRNLLGWHGSFVGKKREKAWRAAPFCLIWTIWKERNRRVFDDIERNDQDIKSIFLYTFVNWARVYIEEHTLSLIDFVNWLATKYGSGLFVPLLFASLYLVYSVYTHSLAYWLLMNLLYLSKKKMCCSTSHASKPTYVSMLFHLPLIPSQGMLLIMP